MFIKYSEGKIKKICNIEEELEELEELEENKMEEKEGECEVEGE